MRVTGIIAAVLAIVGISLLLVNNHNKVRAQDIQGFTATLYDYYGCDPAASTAACPPKIMYTRYVDPVIGTSLVTTELQVAGQPSSTLIQKKDGTWIWSFPEVNSYYAVKLNPPPAPDTTQNCSRAGSTLIDTETLLGFNVYKYRSGAANSSGDGTFTWLAPGLNCFSLRMEAHFAKGPATYQSATAVTLAEPPSAAFSPLGGAVEMAPVDLQRKRFLARTPGKSDADWDAMEKSDKNLDRLNTLWRKQHGL